MSFYSKDFQVISRNLAWPKITGLAVALGIAIAYTVAAFDMDMRTTNGSIGPGYFPRIIGALLIVVLMMAIGRELRTRDVDDSQERPERRDLADLAIFLGAAIAFAIVYVSVSWLIGSMVFLMAVLSWLNRGKHVVNICTAIGVPVIVCLVLDLWLGAQFPQ